MGTHSAQECALCVEDQGEPSPPTWSSATRLATVGRWPGDGQGHSMTVTLLSWASSSTKQH